MNKKKKTKPDPIPLLQAMKEKFQNMRAAQQAFNEFYQTYKGYLFKICHKAMKSYPGFRAEHVKDVVNNIFIKIFEKADTFNPAISGKIVKVTNDEKVKGWMEGIAKNETKLYYRALNITTNPLYNHKEIDDDLNGDDFMMHEEDNNHYSEFTSKQFKYIDECLAKEPLAHQEVFKTRVAMKNDRGNVPSEITQSLEQEFGVHPEYQRVIVKRITDKIKANIPSELQVEQ